MRRYHGMEHTTTTTISESHFITNNGIVVPTLAHLLATDPYFQASYRRVTLGRTVWDDLTGKL